MVHPRHRPGTYKITEMHFEASSSSLSSDSHMTPRAFRVPGILFLFAATVLLIIISVSLPYLPVIDFVRSHVESGNIGVADGQGTTTSPSVSQLKASHLVFYASGWPLIGVVCTVWVVVLLCHRITVWKSRLQHHRIRLHRRCSGQ